MPDFNRYFGGSPGSVLVRLLFLSLLVGAFLAFLGLTPLGLVDRVTRWFGRLFDFSFETVREVGRWLVMGAVIVVPLWLLTRLFARR